MATPGRYDQQQEKADALPHSCEYYFFPCRAFPITGRLIIPHNDLSSRQGAEDAKAILAALHGPFTPRQQGTNLREKESGEINICRILAENSN
jgi:hypothetical protein